MKLHKGQATRISLLVLHQFGHLAMLLLLLVLVLFGLLGFRLSQGPVELPRLASWFASRFTGEGVDVHIDKAELIWAGYHQGGAVPFVLRLAHLQVRTQAGHVLANVPAAVLSMPVADIWGGRKPVILTGEGATFPQADVPVSWYAKLWPGAGFSLSHSDMYVEIGSGHIGTGQDAVALDRAGFILSILHDGTVRVTDGTAQLAKRGDSAPRLTFSFLGHYHQQWQGELNVDVDKVQARDLALIWPPALLPITRQWITTHITSGTAQNAAFVVGLAAQGDLSHLHINQLQGQFNLRDVLLVWLKGAPALAHLNGLFSMTDNDTGLITATSGDADGLRLQSGSMKMTGLAGAHQSGTLKIQLSGPVHDALAVLAAPALNLLAHVPQDVKNATGLADINLSAQIPFERNLKREEVALQVRAKLTHLTVPTGLVGISFTNGNMLLNSDGHMLFATAQADLAGFPASFKIRQVLSGAANGGDVVLQGMAGPVLRQALGINTVYMPIQGVAPFKLVIRGEPQGRQQADLIVDLTPIGLAMPALSWSKQPSSPGVATFSLTLQDQKLLFIQGLHVQAPGLSLLGQGTEAGFRLQQASIGRTQMSATLTYPAGPDAAWVLQGSGPVLDLRLKALRITKTKPQEKLTSSTPKVHPWQISLAFNKIYTAQPPAPALLDARLNASGKAETTEKASFSAQGVVANLTPLPSAPAQHSLSLSGQDAGALLSVLGIYNGVKGGTLSLQVILGAGAVHGALQLTDIRLVHAPGFVKILQAATLYGIAEAMSGPGLLLNHTRIPFTLDNNVLTLNQADFYSEALGFTANGTINLATGICDLNTTIVPAYALNAFLGRLPLIGHIFTAEKGGGLFAMRAHVQGKMDDPQVSVNPFSVFLPGFLRGIFGLGEPEAKN